MREDDRSDEERNYVNSVGVRRKDSPFNKMSS